MAKENDATGEDEGVAALKEDRKGGSYRRRGQRGERVFGSGDLEKARARSPKAPNVSMAKGVRKKKRGGRGIEVAKCLVVFQLLGKVTRGGRRRSVGGGGGVANYEVNDVRGRGKEGKKIRTT